MSFNVILRDDNEKKIEDQLSDPSKPLTKETTRLLSGDWQRKVSLHGLKRSLGKLGGNYTNIPLLDIRIIQGCLEAKNVICEEVMVRHLIEILQIL